MAEDNRNYERLAEDLTRICNAKEQQVRPTPMEIGNVGKGVDGNVFDPYGFLGGLTHGGSLLLQVWNMRALTSIRWLASPRVKVKAKERVIPVASLGISLGNVRITKEKAKEGLGLMVRLVIRACQKGTRKDFLKRVIQKERVVL